MTKPARSRKPKLAEVKPIGTSEEVVNLACEVMAEVQDDNVLAMAVILIRRAGGIDHWQVGSANGFGPQLVFGLQHLTNQLLHEED